MKILVTGAAGFIGFHLVNAMIKKGYTVIGLDNINDYYDVSLKYGRLLSTGIAQQDIEYNKLVDSKKLKGYSFIKLNLEDKKNILALFDEQGFDRVCHLAAQAGVRYSIINPSAYTSSNIEGFLNILEAARHSSIEHLVYASSSSVYGTNKSVPFSIKDNVDHPVSLYAATKKANELMAHTYSHLYNIPTTGLRFFTVYGPWGRPDMAPILFTKAIVEDRPIKVFNYGDMQRDFTYVDDIIKGVEKVLEKAPKENMDGAESSAPYKIYNIGNSAPVKLMKFIETIEKKLGKIAKKEMMPIQPGDVPITFADVKELIKDFGYKPDTTIDEGVGKFVDWYKEFSAVS